MMCVKIPGHLSEGYGRKSDQSKIKFHGGTIFKDAVSKIIHVEYPISWFLMLALISGGHSAESSHWLCQPIVPCCL